MIFCEFKKAILTSVIYWFFGALCFVPYFVFLEEFISLDQAAWIAFGTVLVSIPIVNINYLKYIGQQSSFSPALILGISIVGIHFPSDYIFIKLLAPELLPVFSMPQGFLIYFVFGLGPIFVSSLRKACF